MFLVSKYKHLSFGFEYYTIRKHCLFVGLFELFACFNLRTLQKHNKSTKTI